MLLLSAARQPYGTLIVFERFVPESPHWLLVNGKHEALLRYIKKSAKRNEISLPSKLEIKRITTVSIDALTVSYISLPQLRN